MSRPPIDINKLAARAQGAARALNPPERQATEAIVRRATLGGPGIRLEATQGFLGNERYELPGLLSDGSVTAATHYRNVLVDGFDSLGVRRWGLTAAGVINSYDTAGVLRATMGNTFLGLYDAAGVLNVNLAPSGNARFALTPTVGPAGSAVAVALITDVTGSPAAYQAFYGLADWINTAMSLPTTLTARSAVTIPANTLVGAPVFYARSRTIDRLSIYVNTAIAGNVRLGIARISADGFTATLLADAGTVSPSTVGAKTLTVSVAATPGWYMVWAISDVAVSVSGLVNSAFLASPWDALGTGGEAVAVGSTPIRKLFYSVARTYGVLPATVGYAGGNLSNAAVPILSVRSS